jgi:hypothetical protein
MVRGKSKGFANLVGEVLATDGEAAMDPGNTKAIEATSERSES